MTFLKPGERIDDLQRSQLGIIQNPAHFCFGTDAVLLSGFVRAGGKERVVDLCTGNGIIPSYSPQRPVPRKLRAWKFRRRLPIWRAVAWL